jgi:hypothetical protein
MCIYYIRWNKDEFFLVYVSRNNKDSGAYDLGELDQALFLYLNGQNDPTSVHEQKRKLFFNHMKIM